MIKVVIFDLDDTIISENEYIKSGYKHVSHIIAKRYGLKENNLYRELYDLYKKGTKNVFNSLLDKYQISYMRDDILYLVNEYRNHIPNICFFDDVIPFLDKLKRKGIKIGIISDGYLSTQHNKANVLELYDLYDKVIFTEELGRKYWKPSPKSFEIMKNYFEVKYDEIMYIGDNPLKDFYIGSIYPIKTVRIMRKKSVYKNAEYYQGIKEHYLINSLNELSLCKLEEFK